MLSRVEADIVPVHGERQRTLLRGHEARVDVHETAWRRIETFAPRDSRLAKTFDLFHRPDRQSWPIRSRAQCELGRETHLLIPSRAWKLGSIEPRDLHSA